MNLNQLYYFVKLAHLEHYTKAAAELNITQPSLSHAISALEEELGTYLFEKQGRNVTLTKYGRFFLKYVEESLDTLENGIKKTRAMTSNTSGHIDLAFIYTLGTHFVPEVVNGFIKANPDKQITFTFNSENTSDIIKGLREEKYDIAFCSLAEEEKDIEFTPVAEQELVVIVPLDHPLASQTEIDLRDTIMYPQIGFTKNSGLRPIVAELFEKIQATPNIAYEVEEDGAIAGLVAQGFGISVIPRIPLLEVMQVKVLKIVYPSYKRTIYMGRVRHKYTAPVVSDFAKYATSYARQVLTDEKAALKK